MSQIESAKLQIHAVVMVGVLHPRALAKWIATLPPDWLCHVIPASPEHEIPAELRDARTATFSSDTPASLRAASAMTLLLTDDGVLCAPAFADLQRAHATGSVLLTVPEVAPTSDAYSPSKSARPDHYLAAPAIPGTRLPDLWNGDAEALNRWIGHEIALRARIHDIPVAFVAAREPGLPAIRQTRGTDLILTRVRASRILDLLCGEHAPDVPGASRAEFLDVIEATTALPAHTTPAGADQDRERKARIDRTLSCITAWLSPASVASPPPDLTPFDIRGRKVVLFKLEPFFGDSILGLDFISRVIACEPLELVLVITEELASLIEIDDPRVKVLTLEKTWGFALGHQDPGASLDEMLQTLLAQLVGTEVALFPRYFPDGSFFRHTAMLLGIPVRAGIANARTDEGAYFSRLNDLMLTHVVPVPDDLHEVQKLARFGDRIGLPPRPDASLIRRSDSDAPAPQAGRRIAIGLGASKPSRRWPVERIIEFMQRLHRYDDRLSFALLGGADVAEAAAIIQSGLPFEVDNLAGMQTLPETASELRACTLYVGNDSGAMHLAAAVGTPVVEISMHPAGAPSNHINSPDRLGPIGIKFAVVRPAGPASEACSNGCTATSAHCINLVSSEAVVAAVKDLLEKINSGASNET